VSLTCGQTGRRIVPPAYDNRPRCFTLGLRVNARRLGKDDCETDVGVQFICALFNSLVPALVLCTELNSLHTAGLGAAYGLECVKLP